MNLFFFESALDFCHRRGKRGSRIPEEALDATKSIRLRCFGGIAAADVGATESRDVQKRVAVTSVFFRGVWKRRRRLCRTPQFRKTAPKSGSGDVDRERRREGKEREKRGVDEAFRGAERRRSLFRRERERERKRCHAFLSWLRRAKVERVVEWGARQMDRDYDCWRSFFLYLFFSRSELHSIHAYAFM